MDLLSLLIYLIVLGLIFYVVMWGLGQIGIPEPFNKIIRVILVLIILIIIMGLLLSLLGHSSGIMPRLR